MATGRTRRRHGGQAVKVVVTGPFAAGKPTLIRTISEITVLSTERGWGIRADAKKSRAWVFPSFRYLRRTSFWETPRLERVSRHGIPR